MCPRGTDRACSWHLSGSVSALFPESGVKATATSSERHPMSLVLGGRTPTSLLPTSPCSETNQPGRFRNCRADSDTSETHLTHTHTHTLTPCMYLTHPREPHVHTLTHTHTHTPHIPQRISQAVHSCGLPCGPRGPSSSQVPGQGWVPLRGKGSFSFAQRLGPCSPGLWPFPHGTAVRPPAALSAGLDLRALGAPRPPHWKSLSREGTPPLLCMPLLQDLA